MVEPHHQPFQLLESNDKQIPYGCLLSITETVRFMPGKAVADGGKRGILKPGAAGLECGGDG